MNIQKYANELYLLRPDIKFQNIKIGDYHNFYFDIPNFSWNLNKCFLRYSIETPNLTEIRFDLDDKDLGANIENTLLIKSKLESLGIKAFFYWSGNKGTHIHFLLNIDCFKALLKNSDIKINLLEYKAELLQRKKLKAIHKPLIKSDFKNYYLVWKRNEERRHLKKIILDYFDLNKYTDQQAHSTLTLMGMAGTMHRKSNHYKILLDLDKLNNVNEILKFIEENKQNNNLFDNNFLKTINYLNKSDYNEINNIYSSFIRDNHIFNDTQHSKTIKSSNNGSLLTNVLNLQQIKVRLIEKKYNAEKIISFLCTYIDLYKIYKIDSTNFYGFYLMRFLISEFGEDYELIELCFNLFIQKTNYNMNCSVFEKYNTTFRYSKNRSGQKVMFSYSHNGISWTFLEFINKVNEFRNLFKRNLNNLEVLINERV